MIRKQSARFRGVITLYYALEAKRHRSNIIVFNSASQETRPSCLSVPYLFYYFIDVCIPPKQFIFLFTPRYVYTGLRSLQQFLFLLYQVLLILVTYTYRALVYVRYHTLFPSIFILVPSLLFASAALLVFLISPRNHPRTSTLLPYLLPHRMLLLL